MRSIYSIQGNISSGKSTFLAILKTHLPQLEVIAEPVAEWQSISNKHNLLQQYYDNPTRWAFTFQINAILSRMTLLNKLLQLSQRQPGGNKVLFSERSVVADRHIFAKLLREENKMDEMEYALYLSMYDSLDSLFRTPRIHKFLYLKVSPQRCLDRLRKRARHEESQVQLAYLHKIHLLHEEWLSKEPNVLVIDGEEEFEERPERANAMLQSAKLFLEL